MHPQGKLNKSSSGGFLQEKLAAAQVGASMPALLITMLYAKDNDI